MDTLVSEMLTDALNTARSVYKDGLTGQIILGDRKQIFTLMPKYYSQTDYDVHLINTADIIKELDLIKQLSIQLSSQNNVDPEILIIVSTSKSLTELKTQLLKSIKEKKIENNQLVKLTQELQQAQQVIEQMQKQLEASTKKINSLNERKLAIEQQDNQQKNNINWFKVKSDVDNKKRELDLIENRNKLEALQLVDNNPNNDKIKNEKY